MQKRSAGLLLFRWRDAGPEVLLVHPGGPLWARRDAGAWSIPKGEYQEGDDPLAAARREFQEETGFSFDGDVFELGEVVQRGGKLVKAWAAEHDLDPSVIHGNTFSLVWPPRSGVVQHFPEVDKGEWFSIADAREKILSGQQALLERLLARLSDSKRSGPRVSPSSETNL